MLQIEEITNNIYSFPIVLPDNPLKWLNCYVIKSRNPEERNLLIDSGFRRKECADALLEGMQQLGLTPENTDVFFTHLHSDHCGNGHLLNELGYHIIMGRSDYEHFLENCAGRRPDYLNACRIDGFPQKLINGITENSPAVIYASPAFPAETIEPGAILNYGGYMLEAIDAAGHTPGQLCLYERSKKIMFTADHILFDISPNITFWLGVEDSLGDYLDNLQKYKNYEVELALPAHRNLSGLTMNERIDQLLAHHERRLNETLRIITEEPGMTAYDICGRMTWKIRCRNWDDFPVGQKFFAFGETIAHLDYLFKRGKIERREDKNGIRNYYPLG